MPRSFVDLSIYLENDVLSDPPAFAPRIDYLTHEDSAEEAGAIVELSAGGTRPVPLPSTQEERRFLEDGDSVVLRGWCEKPGAARIGFGECHGEVLAAVDDGVPAFAGHRGRSGR